MTKKVNTPEADVIVEAKGKLELLFEKYGKILLGALVVVGVAVGGYFIYKSHAEANEQERIAKAKRDAVAMVISESADDAKAYAESGSYKGTPAKNYAQLVAAERFMAEGDVDTAEQLVAKFKDIDGGKLPLLANMINAKACGLRGDIAVERGDYDAAVAEFQKALTLSDDQATFVYFNQKLARLYAKMDKGQEAIDCYTAIDMKYPELAGEAEIFL